MCTTILYLPCSIVLLTCSLSTMFYCSPLHCSLPTMFYRSPQFQQTVEGQRGNMRLSPSVCTLFHIFLKLDPSSFLLPFIFLVLTNIQLVQLHEKLQIKLIEISFIKLMWNLRSHQCKTTAVRDRDHSGGPIWGSKITWISQYRYLRKCQCPIWPSIPG